MKKLISISTIILLLPMLICGQQTTSFGDEVGTLDGIIKAYYDVITVKKGEKVSFERDSVLHIPNAIVGITQKDKYGKAILKMISLRQFHNASDAFIEQDGFNEHELARKVENFGSIYQVWSTYETRNISTGPLLERGINSIQLYHDGKRFWIISWIAEDETKQQPIPEKYLINSK